MLAEAIRIRGTVQGVGFRPTVWRLARECGVTGHVLNDASGVLIEAWGDGRAIDELADRIRRESPPLARIEAIQRSAMAAAEPVPPEFTIAASAAGEASTSVAADAACCDACRDDTLDPGNRRYRYPFTNCTHCGPRLSIVRAVPYDRCNTSMAPFALCPDCQKEYDDPADRRFHAQPNACPVCGPTVWLETNAGDVLPPDPGGDAVSTAARLIRDGCIVAIKGIGGFHLACDATNASAVETLRTRKRRDRKPLAMMARDRSIVARYASVSTLEAELLGSRRAPIVVFDANGEALPDAIAPGQHSLGFMLPYTPLHHLLLADLDTPIVMTSGNLSDEPQVTDNDVARDRLGAIADVLLLNNRDIVNRLDDSVVTVIDDEPRLLRRARGYAPEPVTLPDGFEAADGILAMGGELKNTFCLVRRGAAVLSQHMGDMEYADAQVEAGNSRELLSQLYDFTPGTVVVDQHPDYVPTRLGQTQFPNVSVVAVQHHHAHIAACLVEHGIPIDTRPVLGVVLDGLGYGNDGSLWGGEFLLAGYRGFERLAHFLPVALPGGARAMHEPWRNTWAHLDAALGWDAVAEQHADLECIDWLARQPVANLRQMLARSVNCPPASSAGRLFDAVAGALDLHRASMSHEAEAAMALEALASPRMSEEKPAAYSVDVAAGNPAVVSWRPLWQALLDDLHADVSKASIAARFHWGLALAVANLARQLANQHDAAAVVLSGGVFQNRQLLSAVNATLTDAGVRVLSPGAVPANDGGLALGQAAIAASVTCRSAARFDRACGKVDAARRQQGVVRRK